MFVTFQTLDLIELKLIERMAFDGTEGAAITLAEATKFTADFRAGITPGAVIGHFFGKKVLQQILDQPGCMGIRMYYGKETNGAKNLVLVGVDSTETDMINGIIADRSVIIPPIGGQTNVLNS